jgi:3-hydroxyisobutyrate dehydrogenase
MNIGFIGLGNMGLGMATNILKAGYSLTVYDIRKEVVAPLLEAGASWAENTKALTVASDIIFTSLPGPQEVEAVALGEGGIIEGIRPGGVYIDLTSNSPTLIRRIYDRFKKKGAHVMDAPVSGGPLLAQTGKLALMVGGDEEVFQRCKPLLDVMGDKVRYTGGIGNGSICKLLHNCMGFGLQTIVAECFTLGVKAGVDPEVLLQVVKESALGQGAIFHRIMPEGYFKGRFDPPSFALKLAFKDVGLASALGHELNVPMAMADLTLNELMTAVNRGWGNRDSCVSMLLQEERAGGVEVRSRNINRELMAK